MACWAPPPGLLEPNDPHQLLLLARISSSRAVQLLDWATDLERRAKSGNWDLVMQQALNARNLAADLAVMRADAAW
eukprot:1102190-Heterocapsa_arctica.AAC.1